MTERFVDLSETPVHLGTRGALLVIHSGGGGGAETTIPLAEISAVVASHPAVTLTLKHLTGMAFALVAILLLSS